MVPTPPERMTENPLRLFTKHPIGAGSSGITPNPHNQLQAALSLTAHLLCVRQPGSYYPRRHPAPVIAKRFNPAASEQV